MSKLGQKIAWEINQIFPVLSIHKDLEIAKRSIDGNQLYTYNEAKRVVKAFEPYWDLSQKNILDIGTGLGGKIPFYLEYNPKSINAIDINPQCIAISNMLLKKNAEFFSKSDIVHFTISDAAYLPYPECHFDAIISMNVFEHIDLLEEALGELYRVLKPDGKVFLYLPPFFSPWGHHLDNWIHYPWPHLFFSDRTLLSVAAREDAKRQLNSNFVEATQIDWDRSIDRLPNLNRVTICRFKRLLKQTGFSVLQLNLLPIGYDYLQRKPSVIMKFIYRLLLKLCRLPYIQEIIVTKMIFVLGKDLAYDKYHQR